ncbi:MAG: hypothetical protein JW748_06160 [Anaerolineales bacterium]|nr:hypothetical protein [Anaerolineales bacterium]
MSEQPLTPELEKLLQDVKRGGLAFRRIEAAQKIGGLGKSHPRLVEALLRAAETDVSEEVRKAAAGALQTPVHVEMLEKNPGLIELAKVEEVEILKPSVWGLISFALSIISILIIYADVFFITAGPTGVDAGPSLDISPLFCVSFLLSLAGLVFGIIGVRQYGRVKTFSRLGLLFNGLIILGSLFLSMAIRFYIT